MSYKFKLGELVKVKVRTTGYYFLNEYCETWTDLEPGTVGTVVTPCEDHPPKWTPDYIVVEFDGVFFEPLLHGKTVRTSVNPIDLESNEV